MIWFLIGLLIPAGAAWFWIRALSLRTSGDSRAVTAAIAFCVGVGFSSLGAFWWAVLWGGIGPRFAVADALGWTLCGAAGWLRLRRTPGDRLMTHATDRPVLLSRADWLVRGVFVVLLMTVAAAAAAEYLGLPYGQTDATLIWNLKARFMVRGGDDWIDFAQVSRSNPSHPLLVSASVARLWAYAGAESTLMPAAFGGAVGAATAAAVIGALDARRARAWIAGCVLIAPWTFSQSLVAQTADLPFGLYLVVTLIVMCGYGGASGRDSRGVLLLAGVLAGFAAWTKNEGLVLLGVTMPIAAWSLVRTGDVRPFGSLLAGAAPALVAVAWLKLTLAAVPPEYFAGAQATTIQERLVDLERHAHLMSLLWQHWTRWGGPAAAGMLPLVTLAAVAVACTRAGQPTRRVLAVLGLMFGAYCTVWLLSPLEPEWLVTMTFDRLLVQLWPSLVLAAFSHGVSAGTSSPPAR